MMKLVMSSKSSRVQTLSDAQKCLCTFIAKACLEIMVFNNQVESFYLSAYKRRDVGGKKQRRVSNKSTS